MRRLLFACLAASVQCTQAREDRVPELRFNGIYLTTPPPSPIWVAPSGGGSFPVLAVSPDCKRLACVGPGIKLHDTKTGKVVATFDTTIAGEVGRNTFFSPDGSKLFCLSGNGVPVWNVKTGGFLRRLAGTGDVRDAALSPDGRVLVTADNSNVKFTDVESGKLLYYKEGPFGVVAISPDGATAVSAHSSLVSFRSMRDYSETQSFDPRSYGFSGGEQISFGGGGNLLFSGLGADVLDWHRKRFLCKLDVHQIFGRAAVDPSGEYLVGGEYQYLRIWELATGHLRAEFRHQDELRIPLSCAFSPDGKSVYSASMRNVKGWAVEPVLNRVPDAISGSVKALDSDGSLGLAIAAGGFRLLGLEKRRLLTKKLAEYEALGFNAFGEDGRIVGEEERRSLRGYFFHRQKPFAFVAGPQGEIWDLEQAKLVHKVGISIQEFRAIAQGGKAGSSADLAVAVSNLFPRQASGCLALPDKRTLIIWVNFPADYGAAGDVAAWDLETGRRMGNFQGATADMSNFMLSKDGTKLLGAGYKPDVKLWSVQDRKLLRNFTTDNPPMENTGGPHYFTSVAISDDGKRVAAADSLGQLFIWDVDSQKLLSPPLHVSVGVLAFDPEGRRLAAASGNKILLFGIPGLGKAGILSASGDSIQAMAFLKGHVLASWGDGKVRFWPLKLLNAP